MSKVTIITDSASLQDITMSDISNLLATIKGAVALAGGPVIVEWNVRATDRLQVTAITRDGEAMFRRAS